MSSKKAPKNKYITKSHLSERKFRELPRLFCADVTALSAASPTGLNRNTANRCHGMPRARIAEIREADSPFDGEVEADESYFGARRARGVRGRGARGETIAFGLPERGGKVYTRTVPDVTRGTSMQVIEGKVSEDSIMRTDGFASYDGLVDWGYKHHYRVSRGENEFVERGNPGNHINGIESFWGYAKNRLVKYQGIPKEDFYLHLKEREFRFNMRGAGHVQIHASGTPGKAPKLGKPHHLNMSCEVTPGVYLRRSGCRCPLKRSKIRRCSSINKWRAICARQSRTTCITRGIGFLPKPS